MLFRLLLLFAVFYLPLSTSLNSIARAETVSWANPQQLAVKRMSDLPSIRQEGSFLNNISCSSLSYRKVGSANMETGCFTSTAFGMMSTGGDLVIFNGTDEALPLTPYYPGYILVPWPNSGIIVALDPSSTGGAFVNLYTYPLPALRDKRNSAQKLVGKEMFMPPNIQIKDASGQSIKINPQTLAFSDDGSWMMAEGRYGSFIRINLATLEVKSFGPSYTAPGHPGSFESRTAISEDGRFAAIYNQAYSEFKVFDLSQCPASQPAVCGSYNYRPFIGQKIPNANTLGRLRFVNSQLLGFEVRNSGSGDGIYALSPSGSINSFLDYLGLGDSYTSGEGAFNYLAGTDTENNRCHLSSMSYPLLMTQAVFSSAGGRSVACSGAVIKDVISDSPAYRGQVRDIGNYQQIKQSGQMSSIMADFSPGYVAQHRFVGQYQPKILTVSVGGNDIGFGDILEQCLTPRVTRHHSDNDCFSTYEDRLELKNLVDRTIPRWTSLFQHLQQKSAASRLYAIGYPDIAIETGDCALNVSLSRSELSFARELTDYINQAIREAASKAEVSYIDISKALVGHRLCETASHNVAVNGVTSGKDIKVLGVGLFGHESYHPNALGHRLIKQAILDKTGNFKLPVSSATDTSLTLLKGSKTGRAIYTRIPAPNLANRSVKPGQTLSIKLEGGQFGLKPDGTYQVKVDDPNGQPIGSITPDSAGNIDGTIQLPENILPGGHTIHVVGDNQSGQPTDVTQPIFVPDDEQDPDGDGIKQDSCPMITNSGTDADHDGLDDACDPLVGLPSSQVSSSLSGSRTTVLASSPAKPVFRESAKPMSAPLTTSSSYDDMTPRAKLRSASAKVTNYSTPNKWLWILLLVTICLIIYLTIKIKGDK